MNDLIQIDPKEARALGARSLTAYGRLYFPKTFRQKSPEIHEAIGRALYGAARYNAFMLFRDAAKTTLLRTYTSQRIAYNVSRTIMYLGVSQPHAVMSLRWLKRAVEFNRRWTTSFGLKPGKKWTDEWLEIDHEVAGVTISVIAAGITGQIRGFNIDDFRPDLIIADDILNEENTNTPDQRKKVEDLFFGALLNSLAPASEAPWAKAVFLQTPFNKQDAISKCMLDPEWNPVALGIFDEKGESRWPERYPTLELRRAKEAAIRRGQYRLWMREKEVTIVSGEEQAINVENLRYYDVLPEHMDCVISVDPASSDAKTADDHATVALGFHGVDVYVLDYKLTKGTMPDKAANDFFQLALLYGIYQACVETISYQRVLKWFLEQEMVKRRVFLTIDPIQDKRPKPARIMQNIPALVNYGHFYIRPGMQQLITQMDEYDPEVKDQPDDLLDAIATGITKMNPGIRAANTIEGEYRVEDESQYEALEFGGAP